MSAIQENVPLMPFNTFHLDIKARYIADFEDVNQIQDFMASSFAKVRPRLILGGGSNVLFIADYEGLVIRPLIKGIVKIKEDKNSILIRAGAGENWDSFVAWCVERELGGIENLSLIPGTVGASPIQNIGAYGAEVKETIDSIEVVMCDTGKKMRLSQNDCRFEYRDSVFKHELRDKTIITHVIFKFNKHHQLKIGYGELEKELSKFPGASVKTLREAVINIRRRKLPDPEDIGNAGSFFKNPVIPENQISGMRKVHPEMPVYAGQPGMLKLSAAWLIDQSGWKGKKEGNTGTYMNQPLILVNHGGATGREILNFANKIQKSVMDQFKIQLELEVNVVGE
jgi:UDP-N-acetylmuramate dehydrogenase